MHIKIHFYVEPPLFVMLHFISPVTISHDRRVQNSALIKGDNSQSEEIMKVQMRKEAIQKGIIELGIVTLKDAANKANCNLRTFKRAINGSPVQLRTAKRICEGLRLDPMEALEVPRKGNIVISQVLNARLEEYGIEEIAEAELVAFEAAGKAIRETLETHGEYTQEQVSNVLAILFLFFGMEFTANNPKTAIFFVDEIAHDVKTILYSEISLLESIANPHSSFIAGIKSKKSTQALTSSLLPNDVLERLKNRYQPTERRGYLS